MNESDNRYEKLLDALASFVLFMEAEDDQQKWITVYNLGAFLRGHAGKAEWETVMENARARRKKALLRQMQPEFWSD